MTFLMTTKTVVSREYGSSARRCATRYGPLPECLQPGSRKQPHASASGGGELSRWSRPSHFVSSPIGRVFRQNGDLLRAESQPTTRRFVIEELAGVDGAFSDVGIISVSVEIALSLIYGCFFPSPINDEIIR